MIKIVNRRKERGHFYCGRGGPLGNPYPMPEFTRDEACDQFDRDFEKIRKKPEAHNLLVKIWNHARTHDVTKLECYCAPERCHCETIKRFIESHLP